MTTEVKVPFKSQAQRRFFHAAQARGEIPGSTVKKWEKETPKGKKLPEHVKKSAAFAIGVKLANGEGEDEGKGRVPTEADKAKIRAFIKSKPRLSDDEFHDFCEKLGVNVHKAEEVAYEMARGLAGGRARDQKNKVSAKELALGHKVETEHTKSPKVTDEISRDHLAEIPDYYTRLKKMEAEAEKRAAFMAGAKTATEDLYYGLNLREDTRVRAMKELAQMDPEERKRYLADMSARNHRLAIESPNTKVAATDG